MGNSGSSTSQTKIVQIKPAKGDNPAFQKETVNVFKPSNSQNKRKNKSIVSELQECTLLDVQNEKEALPENETNVRSDKYDEDRQQEATTKCKRLEEIILTSITPITGQGVTDVSNTRLKFQDVRSPRGNESQDAGSRAMALLSVTPSAMKSEEIVAERRKVAVSRHDDVQEETDKDNADPTDENENSVVDFSRAEDINLHIMTPRSEIPKIKESCMPRINALVEQFWSANARDDALPCWVHGLATIADGYILVLDLNNNKLKLFDEKYTFCCAVSVSEECHGITSVYSNEVAMTSGSDVLFYFVDKEGFILQQRCFKLNGEGFGISYGHKNFAVTCDINSSKACIRILNDKGKQRYVIKSCFGSSVKMTKFVQLDPSKDVVYISDVRKKRILSVTFEGSELWEVNIDDEPRGIICMPSYILVADHRLHQLLQISCDGTDSRVLLTEDDDLWNPEYLIFNSKTNHLLISTPENIMVFKIV